MYSAPPSIHVPPLIHVRWTVILLGIAVTVSEILQRVRVFQVFQRLREFGVHAGKLLDDDVDASMR